MNTCNVAFDLCFPLTFTHHGNTGKKLCPLPKNFVTPSNTFPAFVSYCFCGGKVSSKCYMLNWPCMLCPRGKFVHEPRFILNIPQDTYHRDFIFQSQYSKILIDCQMKKKIGSNVNLLTLEIFFPDKYNFLI